MSDGVTWLIVAVLVLFALGAGGASRRSTPGGTARPAAARPAYRVSIETPGGRRHGPYAVRGQLLTGGRVIVDGELAAALAAAIEGRPIQDEPKGATR